MRFHASCPSKFVSSDRPTLGVEIELQLVDRRTMGLRSGINQILARLPEALSGSVKPELMQCYLEINTGVCRTVADVERDLTDRIRAVQEIAAAEDLRLFWGATHPFSPWYLQEVTPNERYLGLIELLQETARRLVTFGLHVHVGAATNPDEADHLSRWRDGEDDWIDTADLLDVLRRHPSARLDPEQLVALQEPLQPRLYSISSSLRAHPDEVHLTVGVVRYQKGDRLRKGVASTFLGERIAQGASVPRPPRPTWPI